MSWCIGEYPLTIETKSRVIFWWYTFIQCKLVLTIIWIQLQIRLCQTLGLFYYQWLTLIRAWIHNRIHHKVWDGITSPFPNCTVEVWELLSYSIPPFIGYMITHPDSKVHGANMGPTWVLSSPDGPHVGPMNLAIRVIYAGIKVKPCQLKKHLGLHDI